MSRRFATSRGQTALLLSIFCQIRNAEEECPETAVRVALKTFLIKTLALVPELVSQLKLNLLILVCVLVDARTTCLVMSAANLEVLFLSHPWPWAGCTGLCPPPARSGLSCRVPGCDCIMIFSPWLRRTGCVCGGRGWPDCPIAPIGVLSCFPPPPTFFFFVGWLLSLDWSPEPGQSGKTEEDPRGRAMLSGRISSETAPPSPVASVQESA